MSFNNERMKEHLRGKIDSYEKWKEAVIASGSVFPNDRHYSVPEGRFMELPNYSYAGSALGLNVAQAWWIEREVARSQLGIYPEPTEVMTEVIDSFALQSYMIHMSAEDPAMVAYTATTEDGLRDKQVRLSFGKLLRKLVPLLTDNHIQYLESSHRSELDPTFLVARTEQEIQRVYTEMSGDSGCMRYDPSNWGLTRDLHPSHVYAYAGLGVAYTEVDGVIKSRSVIFDNPDDPADKRYVRIYGDRALARKLARNGYREGSLAGAKIKAIDLHKIPGTVGRNHHAGTYLVAYLDGPGGRQGEYAGSFGYILEGEDCIRLIGRAEATALTNMGYSVPRLKDTSAKFKVPTVPLAKLSFTCYATKREYNTLEATPALAFIDGEVRTVAVSAVECGAVRYDYTVRTRNEGTNQNQVVYITAADKDKHTFYDNHYHGESFIDTPENRRVCHQVLLSEKHGYPVNTWEFESNVILGDPSDDASWVRKVDTMLVFDEEGNETYVLKSKWDELREHADYAQVLPKGNTKAITHIKNPNFVTTVGRKKCVAGWHDIRQLADGTWDYAVNTGAIRIFNGHVYYSLKTGMDVRMDETGVRRILKAHIDAASGKRLKADRRALLERYFRDLMRYGFRGRSFYVVGDALMRSDSGTSVTLEHMRAAVNKLAAMDDQAVKDTFDESYLGMARGFQHHAQLMFKIYDELMASWADSSAQPEAAAPAPGPVVTATAWPVAASHVERFATAA